MKTDQQKKADLDAEAPAQDWHYADVIAALHKAGWTLASLGEKHGLKSGETFSKALRYSFPLAEARIAGALGVHPMVVWPSRYHKNGERKLQGFHAIQSTKRRAYVNGKDSAANSHEQA